MKLKLFIMLILTVVAMGSLSRWPVLSCETPHEGMFVNFVTEASCIGHVKYREIGGSWSVRSDSSAALNHHIYLPCYPYTQYQYIILADGDSIGPYSFWTAPEPGAMEDFQFCAYGDTRNGHTMHSTVIDHMESCHPMFVTHSGDMIDDGHDNSQWDTYFEVIADWNHLAREAPFFYAMGNHDDESVYFYDAVKLPQNPHGTEAYSSFDWGRIHFVAINSEIDYSLTSDQYEFLSNDLTAASSNPAYDFIIGLVHRPLYSSGYHGREEDLAEVLEPLLIANDVDLVIQGHDHMYERSYAQDGVIYVVSGGGGAPPSPIFWWLPHSAFGYNLYHHLEFIYEAEEHKLSMYMHNYSDEIIDSLILVNPPVSVEGSEVPEKTGITGYPNPFNSFCRICRPYLDESETYDETCIEIYDITGTIVRRENIGRGCCFVWWGKDNAGKPVPSGVYVAKFVPGTEDALKLTLLK